MQMPSLSELIAPFEAARYDAFGRQRVVNPVTLFDSQLEYGLSPYVWETTGSGTVTHVPADSAAHLSTDAGEVVARTTYQYFRYQPGKSQLIMLTGVIGDKVEGSVKRVGYFDAQNGLFFEQNGTVDIAFVVRKNGSDTRYVLGEAWTSSLDFTKAQIFFFDLEWLGVGRVRCGFVVNGMVVPALSIHHANLSTSVYMRTANLPVRYELDNSLGAENGVVLHQICCVVISEGGFEESRGLTGSASRTAAKSISTRAVVMSIRAASLINSIVNRATINPEDVSLFTSSADIYWELIFGGTLAGSPSWSQVNSGAVEYDLAGTTISGGIRIAGDILPSGQSANVRTFASKNLNNKLPITLKGDGTPGAVLSLVATGLSGTANVRGTISWRELW